MLHYMPLAISVVALAGALGGLWSGLRAGKRLRGIEADRARLEEAIENLACRKRKDTTFDVERKGTADGG